jgi:hypothetical protein
VCLRLLADPSANVELTEIILDGVTTSFTMTAPDITGIDMMISIIVVNSDNINHFCDVVFFL